MKYQRQISKNLFLYKIILLFVICLLLMLKVRPQTPVNIILDTDISVNCDDAGALAVLYTLADRDEVNILSVAVNSVCEYNASSVDIINTFYFPPLHSDWNIKSNNQIFE